MFSQPNLHDYEALPLPERGKPEVSTESNPITVDTSFAEPLSQQLNGTCIQPNLLRG